MREETTRNFHKRLRAVGSNQGFKQNFALSGKFFLRYAVLLLLPVQLGDTSGAQRLRVAGAN